MAILPFHRFLFSLTIGVDAAQQVFLEAQGIEGGCYFHLLAGLELELPKYAREGETKKKEKKENRKEKKRKECMKPTLEQVFFFCCCSLPWSARVTHICVLLVMLL